MPVPSKLTVDFTGVEVSGGKPSDHIPEGDYLFQIENCELRKKKDDPESKYLSWYLGVVKPAKYKGKHIYHTTSLKQEALWSLRSFLVDLLGEAKVPKQALDIPLAAIVSKKLQIGATVQDDEYNNKIKTKIAATFPKGDYAEAEQAETAATDEDSTAETPDDDVEELDLDDL